jgi:hypothetical protein
VAAAGVFVAGAAFVVAVATGAGLVVATAAGATPLQAAFLAFPAFEQS